MVSFAIACLILQISYAQFIPISTEEKINHAELIIEGEIISQTCFLTEEGYVYTKNILAPRKLLKGTYENNQAIEIVTRGGTLNQRVDTWTHLLQLEVGNYGVFFLNKEEGLGNHTYTTFSSGQGFYKFTSKGNSLKASDILKTYSNIQEEIYSKIEKITQGKIQIIPATSSEEDAKNCLNVSITPFQVGSTFVELGVSAFVDEAPMYLKSFDLIVAYDKDQLGENIINNGVLQLKKGNQIPNNFYDIDAVDLSPNSISISITPKNGQSSYLLLDQFPKEILQLKINMSQGVFQPDIIVSENQIQESVVLVEPEINLEQPAECVKTWLSKGNQAACPVITTFTPQIVAAGVRDMSLNGIPGIITISGLNFGNPSAGYLKPHLSDVLFYDVDLGWFPAAELEYISWSDTKIEMRVPTMRKGGGNFSSPGACTNKIKLFTTDFISGDTCTTTSIDDLAVQFSLFNDSWKQDILNWETSQGVFSNVTIHGGNRRNLIERNNMGGYDLLIQDFYTDSIKNNAAKDQAIKALDVYRCKYKINVKEAAIAPDVLMRRGTLPTGLMSTTMMRGNSSSIICSSVSNTDSGIKDFEVIVNEQVLDTLVILNTGIFMFNLSDTIPSDTANIFYTDFQRIMIHELGHAFQLRHTNNPGDIMISGGVISPNLRFNNFNRTLSANDTLGVNHIYLLSKLGTCSNGAMMDYICTTGTSDIQETLNSFHLYPNPASNFITLETNVPVSQIYVDLFTIDGIKILNRVQSDNPESIKIELPSNLQNGIYVSRSYDKTGKTFSINKFIIQK